MAKYENILAVISLTGDYSYQVRRRSNDEIPKLPLSLALLLVPPLNAIILRLPASTATPQGSSRRRTSSWHPNPKTLTPRLQPHAPMEGRGG